MFQRGLAASTAVAILLALVPLHAAFRSYVVQDDARQHVFWMLRFVDERLFPGDVIADYFQSVAPFGYAALYHVFAVLGVNPLVLAKLLPLVLGLIAASYCYLLVARLSGSALAAFAASALLSQSLWMRDDLVSATPRAFATPLLLAFLYYLVQARRPGCLLVLALQGLCYPQMLLVSVVIVVLHSVEWKGEEQLDDAGSKEGARSRPTVRRSEIPFLAVALAIAVVVLLPYLVGTSGFGPVLTRPEAVTMPELAPGGRSQFFSDDPLEFWLSGSRSGVLPDPDQIPPLAWLGLLLPVFVHRASRRADAEAQLRATSALLLRVVVASLVLFGAAHLVLFRLHLPSRYTQHSLPLVLSIAAGIVLARIVDRSVGALLARGWLAKGARANISSSTAQRRVAAALLIVILLVSLAVSELSGGGFYHMRYVRGADPSIYEYLARQPRGILTASLSEEAELLPSLTGRSILAGRETAIPYHEGYYDTVRRRLKDTIRAHYNPDPQALASFNRSYGVDFWLVDRDAFDADYLDEDRWLAQYQPEADEARRLLASGGVPALRRGLERCAMVETKRRVLVRADCR